MNVDAPIPFTSGQMQTRWIGVLPSTATLCPVANAPFSTAPMFGAGAPAGLSSYCIYEDDSPGTPIFSGQIPAGFLLEPDLQVVVAAGLSDVMDQPFASLTVQQITHVPAQTPSVAERPRLTIVDTSPTMDHAAAPWDFEGNSDHGYVLSNIARRFGCDGGGNCVQDVHTRLGLHLKKDGTGQIVADEVDGGHFGAIGYVAQAVRAEVLDWVTSSDAPLILNLSIGWDPQWGGNPTAMSTWPLSVRAMYDALHDAACRGVMVTVASGNQLGGPPPDDLPLYPAGWGHLTLTTAACDARTNNQTQGVFTGDPLLYPIGAVDGYGERLILSRPNSQPPVVGYGNHATVFDSAGNATSILTGTSIGTIAASTAAAAIWENRPGYRAQQVFIKLRDSGLTTAQDVAPYWCPTGCGKSKYVKVCDAVAWACNSSSPGYAGTPCARTPTSVTCTTPPVMIPNPVPTEIATYDSGTPDYTFTPSTTYNLNSACGTRELYTETSALALDPCPLQQYHAQRAEPWLYPQPMHEECPACYMAVGPRKVYIELTSGFSGVQSLTLEVQYNSGSSKTYTTTSVPSSGNSATYTVGAAVVTDAKYASVTANYTSSSQISANLQVLP